MDFLYDLYLVRLGLSVTAIILLGIFIVIAVVFCYIYCKLCTVHSRNITVDEKPPSYEEAMNQKEAAPPTYTEAILMYQTE